MYLQPNWCIQQINYAESIKMQPRLEAGDFNGKFDLCWLCLNPWASKQLTGSNRYEKWCAWFSKWALFTSVQSRWREGGLESFSTVIYTVLFTWRYILLHGNKWKRLFSNMTEIKVLDHGTDLPTLGLKPKKRSWHWSHLRPVSDGWAHTHCPEWAAHTCPTAPTEWHSHTSHSLSPSSDRKKPAMTHDAKKHKQTHYAYVIVSSLIYFLFCYHHGKKYIKK